MEPIKEGETICSGCKGRGRNAVVNEIGVIRYYEACNKCKGHGKLDWVEMVVGKRRWNITPGTFTQINYPDFEQSMKEIRESIKDMFKIPKELMISEDE